MALAFITFNTLRLKARSPPKNFFSARLSDSSLAKRNSINLTVIARLVDKNAKLLGAHG